MPAPKRPAPKLYYMPLNAITTATLCLPLNYIPLNYSNYNISKYYKGYTFKVLI
jgi:hypothetical protein